MAGNLKELLLQWKLKADNDIQTIINEIESQKPVTDSICYHSQQSVEKYLKLFLVSNSLEPLKTHNIRVLRKECEKLHPSFSELCEIDYLSEYSVELRYPDNFRVPEMDEALEAYRLACKVQAFVSKLVFSIDK